MKTISKNLSSRINMILLASPMLFNQAYANYYFGCGYLHVLINYDIYEKYQLLVEPVVHHGGYLGCKGRIKAVNPVKAVEDDECVKFVFEQTFLAYGPDIELIFSERMGNKSARIRIQQNFCFSEAGNISVEPISGVFTYRIVEGNYKKYIPGKVEINGIIKGQ